MRSFYILLLASFFPFFCEASDIVYLTWQRDPCHTMTIQWLTEQENTQDIVEYRTTKETKWQKSRGVHTPLPGTTPYLVHRTELSDLESNTLYFFKLSGEGEIFKFKTMPERPESPIKFVVGGDIYHDGIEAVIETNKQAAQTNPHFALVGGDLAYAADRIGVLPEKMQSWVDWTLSSFDLKDDKRYRWVEWLQAWKDHMVTPDGCLIPMVPALGNHDVNGGFNKTSSDAAYFHTLFAFPGTDGYNVIDFGEYLSIFVLDSGHTNPIGGKQTNWLYDGLRKRRHITNKFAIYHVPAYPSFRKYQEKIPSAIRCHWVPLFDYFGVHAAFEHHDHTYKRTHPIRHGEINAKGMLFIGDGCWGIEAPRQPKDPDEVWYLAKTASKRHFILVSLANGKRTYTAIDHRGKMIDKVEN